MLRAYAQRCPLSLARSRNRLDQYLVRQAALRSARDTARPPSFDDGLPAGPRPDAPAVDTKVQ
jgi:hypothetical protein